MFFYHNDISSIYITLECTAVAAAVVLFWITVASD